MASIQNILVIAGPTASGKTAVGIELAQRIDGEIVSADARQIYRFMDIGTAKPTAEERAAARHHLIDFVNPDEDYSAGQFAEDAAAGNWRYSASRQGAHCGRGSGVVYPCVVRWLFTYAENSDRDSRAIAGRGESVSSQIVRKTV